MTFQQVKCGYYLRIVRLVVDLGTETARKVFYRFKPKDEVRRFFQSETILDELLVLKRKHIISVFQYSKLTSDPDPDEFDISLFVILLTNLFKCAIIEPVNGWGGELDDGDFSLGADLLRLKNIRNEVVAHRPNAKLSQDEFESLWKRTEDILRRLSYVTPETMAEYEGKIALYRKQPLDDIVQPNEMYLDMLQKWYYEDKTALSELQTQVEKYLKKAEEFNVFFSNPVPDRYWRFVQLLYEGGKIVSTALLENWLRDRSSCLHDEIVSKKKEILDCPSVAAKLFPNHTINLDVSTWGFLIFLRVIKILMDAELDWCRKDALDYLKKATENYAEEALASLDTERFRGIWTDLVKHISILATTLGEETLRKCQMSIETCDKDPVNVDIAKSYIAELQRDCHPFQNLIAMYMDTREELKAIVEQMKREGACFAKEQE